MGQALTHSHVCARFELRIKLKIGALEQTVARRPELSTSGGTSDGRFIAPHGIDVVEIGPINRTIHKVNEEVRIEDIFALEAIYLHILRKLLT